MRDEERIGIRELRQHASRYVAMAREGRRVAVTDRGVLVAYLVPADEPSSPLARLKAAGMVRPGVGNILEIPAERAGPGVPSLSEALQELRDDEPW